MTGDSNREAWLAEGNARQARKRVAAKGIIRDHNGHILLVDPNYKKFWDLPGGMAEANEAPTKALQREIREELNLKITVGKLLVLDWIGPHGPWDDQLTFLFDCGTLTTQRKDAIRITDDEIAEYSFFDPSEAVQRLRSDIADRLTRAITALETGNTYYAETEPNQPE